MFFIISLLQEVDINEKIKNAPDNSYEIGVFIGSLLPFVTLVIIAYLLFRYNKNRKNKD
jgi:Na+/melibiose symporter-like transporter